MTDILIDHNDSASLDLHCGNRQGMIAGATCAGKSVSLMVRSAGSQLGRQILCAALGSIFGGKR